MIKTIMVILPILMLGLVPIANAHTISYNVGFKAGHDDFSFIASISISLIC